MEQERNQSLFNNWVDIIKKYTKAFTAESPVMKQCYMANQPKYFEKQNKQRYKAVEDAHHSRLGEHAEEMWKYKKITDVIVILKGAKFPAHKTVLSCYSKYFNDLLLEPTAPDRIIYLDHAEISLEVFDVLLKFMYTSQLNVTCQNIGDLYIASKVLRMDRATQICIDIFSGKMRPIVYPVYMYVAAKKWGQERAAEKALEIMSKQFEHIVGTPEFLDLSPEQIIEYLSMPRLATRSEVIVYLGGLKWISVNYFEREEYAYDVVNCTRFASMSLNEILACHTPPLLPAIVEIKEIKDLMMQATCYVAARTVDQHHLFQQYACESRTYLIPREPLILWDPNVFDPKRYANYMEHLSAIKIQASYRGYHTRKSLSDAAGQMHQEFQWHRVPKVDSLMDRIVDSLPSSTSSYLTEKELPPSKSQSDNDVSHSNIKPMEKFVDHTEDSAKLEKKDSQ